VPLVPAAIGGTDRLRRLGPLRVAYGEPIELSDLEELDVKEASSIATERLMESIDGLKATL
jgi:1-acyl-sn-glycerol-3-phosphate acyltransferase